MRLRELKRKYTRRRREAEELDALVPLATICDAILDDLRRLDGVDASPAPLTTSEAAERLGVQSRTVARWCREDRLPNAYKTGEEGEGEWRIPPADVDAGPNGAQAPTEDRVRFDRKREREP